MARLLARIDTEYEAARRGMQGLAQGTAYHEFITARSENISRLHKELGELVGSKEEAMSLLVKHQAAQHAALS